LKNVDKKNYIEKYEKRLAQYGYSPLTLGWGKGGRQDVRFSVLAKDVLKHPDSSVLDVGCGFADLEKFLTKRGWKGKYTGIDIVPGLIETALKQNKHLDVRQIDITGKQAETLGQYDYVISSGALNARLLNYDNNEHIRCFLSRMYEKANICVTVDFMTSYVDWHAEGSWHTDPGWAYGEARKLSKRIMIRSDYMPWEFALIIYKDDRISKNNVFQAVNKSVKNSTFGGVNLHPR